MTADPSGNVAVARCIATPDPIRNRLAIAMLRASTGVQRWQRAIPRTDFCFAPFLLANDVDDLVVAAGLTATAPTRRTVVKLAGSDGHELWRDETAAGFPRGLVRRPDGSIVVSDDRPPPRSLARRV